MPSKTFSKSFFIKACQFLKTELTYKHVMPNLFQPKRKEENPELLEAKSTIPIQKSFRVF